MFPAALEYAVIDQIKLNSSSFAIHNEKNVVAFYNFIVPAHERNYQYCCLKHHHINTSDNLIGMCCSDSPKCCCTRIGSLKMHYLWKTRHTSKPSFLKSPSNIGCIHLIDIGTYGEGRVYADLTPNLGAREVVSDRPSA
uniref:Uncharacterized protein n=1 Tax=Solanum tuberosum TaxID=4113 RepID=M1BCM9_SOLTU